MTNYRAFPSTNGPANVSAASGGWLIGMLFSTLGAMSWFDGYYIWVPSNGDTTARKFALWNIYALNTSAVVAGSVVTSGTMTQGAWNYVPLANPIQLAPGGLYCAAAGWTVSSGISVSSGQFGTGGTYAAGITNGPLTVWSTQGASNPFPASTGDYNFGQMMFSNSSGADPSAAMPNNSSGSDNLWLDVQISNTPPAGYAGSYRLWPNTGDLGNYSLDTANNFTLGIEFSLSQACKVNNIWFYSPPTVTQIPTKIGVYQVSGTSLVGSNSSPSWSAAAGAGWMSAALGGNVILQPGVNYKAVLLNGAGTPAVWNAAVANYWTTGFGVNGLTSGPITAPNNASATSPGQESYNLGSALTYPNTNVGPYHYGVDIELTPVIAGGGMMMAGFP